MGGSLITDKSRPRTFRKDHIKRLANEIHELQKGGIDFLLGTGAGSFGHFTAHHYGLRDGARTTEQLYGMCLTHNATQRLSGLVADEFTNERVAVFTVSPSSMMSCQDGDIASINAQPLRNMLDSSIVPIVHGDMITDTTRGATILSTEKVFHECMKQLRLEYGKISLIYLLDADGILDKEHNVISQLTSEDTLFIHESHTHDVTGGIEGKLKSARKALEYADMVQLVNGSKPNAIEQVLAGRDVGTRVVS